MRRKVSLIVSLLSRPTLTGDVWVSPMTGPNCFDIIRNISDLTQNALMKITFLQNFGATLVVAFIAVSKISVDRSRTCRVVSSGCC